MDMYKPVVFDFVRCYVDARDVMHPPPGALIKGIPPKAGRDDGAFGYTDEFWKWVTEPMVFELSDHFDQDSPRYFLKIKGVIGQGPITYCLRWAYDFVGISG